MAASWAGTDMALLLSSRREHYTGNRSFLLLDALETHRGDTWNALPSLPEGPGDGLPYWVGYIGYGMRHDSIPLARGAASPIALPGFMLTRYGSLFVFDHDTQRIDAYTTPGHTLAALDNTRPMGGLPEVIGLQSNFSRAAYEHSIERTLEEIGRGHFYQANITRKFFGRFADAPDTLTLFSKLCAASPAPFSAYLRQEGTAILSSSPESFLSLRDTQITTRPIKGSAPRGCDETHDRMLREALHASSKNQAENLMITDLMRHDLSQVSVPGTVRVEEQSGLYSYATIHHLISTITATRREGVSSYDVVRACFPPGSMTGAPKRAAMEWCTAQERLERGVYSGALGWFGAGGDAELSVVIRTLVTQGERFEFQVGGGIVADSTPTDEWKETLVKARGLGKALGISEAQLEAL